MFPSNSLAGEIFVDYNHFSHNNVANAIDVVVSSNTTNYLDVGYHAGVGAEYQVVKQLSLGLDYRYTVGAGDP